MDKDGGAMISISNLSPDIQKQLNYNPALAAVAANQRKRDDDASAVAIAQEREQAKAIADKQEAATSANEREITANYKKNIANMNADAARANIANVQADMGDMVRLREVQVNPKTGEVTGTSYWVDKYNADSAAINQYNQIIVAAGNSK